tara:strand:- start:222 stop:800 length:579 start_codon:yes stop_codon:yes gene_type:complete
MFSGIIENLGKIKSINIENQGMSLVLLIDSPYKLSIGTSVAINGTCLTLENIDNTSHSFYISSETLMKTNFKYFKEGYTVNVEYPLTLNKFISGHITTGHIDGNASIYSFSKREKAWELVINLPENVKKYVVSKGSICVDGVSLTVNSINDNRVSIMIIPHTYEYTIIKHYKVGFHVNIEVDYIAKHLEKLK